MQRHVILTQLPTTCTYLRFHAIRRPLPNCDAARPRGWSPVSKASDVQQSLEKRRRMLWEDSWEDVWLFDVLLLDLCCTFFGFSGDAETHQKKPHWPFQRLFTLRPATFRRSFAASSTWQLIFRLKSHWAKPGAWEKSVTSLAGRRSKRDPISNTLGWTKLGRNPWAQMTQREERMTPAFGC